LHTMTGPGHMYLHQDAYLAKLKPIDLGKSHSRLEGSPLTKAEHFAFRSLLCSMLWVCLTRLDVIGALVQLQQEMVSPFYHHAKEANALLRRAIKDAPGNGLHFRRLQEPLRICGISDSGHATKRSLNSQEGRLCLLMSDACQVSAQPEYTDAEYCENVFGGFGHPLFFSGKKSTRVSHSTSHSESLAAVGTTQMAQLIAHRLSEPFAAYMLGKWPLKSADFLHMQDINLTIVRVDHVTDCMDLFELVTGERGLSNDKSQRIVISSLREDRMRGNIRTVQHFPTAIMLADGLTKEGIFPQLLRYCTSGYVGLYLPNGKQIRLRVRPPTRSSTVNTDEVGG
jgi:hypothetical protein